MTSLLRADFQRIMKDKLLMVMGILAIGFAAVSPLLYALVFNGVGLDPSEDELVAHINAKSQFFSSFAFGSNVGLIAPVLLAIALCKDFTYGTVRNKIISGKSRTEVFMSLFITCSAIFIGVMLLHGFATLGISLIFFEYQPDPFTLKDFGYMMESLGFVLLTLLCVSAFLSWLCASAKNVGLVIVFFIAATFLLSLAAGILQIVISVLEVTGGNERTISILEFINRINLCNATTQIGAGDHYTLEDTLYLVLPSVIGILSFLSLGLWKFNKKDLK